MLTQVLSIFVQSEAKRSFDPPPKRQAYEQAAPNKRQLVSRGGVQWCVMRYVMQYWRLVLCQHGLQLNSSLAVKLVCLQYGSQNTRRR